MSVEIFGIKGFRFRSFKVDESDITLKRQTVWIDNKLNDGSVVGTTVWVDPIKFIRQMRCALTKMEISILGKGECDVNVDFSEKEEIYAPRTEAEADRM